MLCLNKGDHTEISVCMIKKLIFLYLYIVFFQIYIYIYLYVYI